jgi:CRISPR-associated protein Cmr5
MSVHTRSQRFAQAAFPRIQDRKEKLSDKQFKEYTSFAKKFPSLIHTCGLAQAVAFALAKKEAEYIGDLTNVLQAAGHVEITERDSLDHQARKLPLNDYLRLSRNAISAASWLKRYVEAIGEAV